jgi:hypothetical protein
MDPPARLCGSLAELPAGVESHSDGMVIDLA